MEFRNFKPSLFSIGIAVILTCASVVLLTSCGRASNEETDDSFPNATTVARADTSGHYYYIKEYTDLDTGVVYIICVGCEGVTMTPKLNSNGSIYTIEK